MRHTAIYKRAPMHRGKISKNQGEGVAAFMGNLDRQGDVIYPGAFPKRVLADFVENGFIGLGHDWEGEPIGIPLTATATGNELFCTWQYHETPKATSARDVAIQRQEMGRSIGLSVGFMPDYDGGNVAWFEKGEDLLKDAEASGCDMTLFDAKAIKGRTYVRGIRRVAELYEFSQVSVPANPRATASTVKGLWNDFVGPRADLTLEDQLEMALAAVCHVSDRFRSVAEMRAAENRAPSAARIDQIRKLRKQLDDLLALAPAPIDEDLMERIRRLTAAS